MVVWDNRLAGPEVKVAVSPFTDHNDIVNSPCTTNNMEKD